MSPKAGEVSAILKITWEVLAFVRNSGKVNEINPRNNNVTVT